MKIEICANSYESAINAQKGGADRIELCSELAVGGITPSYGFIKTTLDTLTIPVNVLIRPRSGDFTYSEAEFDIMKRDILFCKQLGCNGIVAGILTSDNSLDIRRTQILADLAKPLSFTFHRAFDWVNNPLHAIDKLIEIGVNRVLTSGQETSAVKGIELLKKLRQYCSEKLVILPGGGITIHNVLQFKNTGFKEVHFSATKLHRSISTVKVSMNSNRFFDETQIAISDITAIKEIASLVK